MNIANGFLFAQANLPPDAEPSGAASGVQPDFIGNAIDWVIAHTSTSQITYTLATYGPNVLSAIAVFFIGRWLARMVTSGIVRAARRARVDETLVGFLNNLIYMLLFTAVCISSLQRLGVKTDSLTAVLAAAGFAIGMAMQGSLGNLASGVMLVFFKPFRVGDVVEVGGNTGRIVEIQIFNTILLTLDNVRIIVPNAKITDGPIQNYSAERERRIDLVIGCGYNDDLKKVKATLEEIVTSTTGVLQDPEPVVAVGSLGDSSVDFVVRPWVLSGEYWDVRFALTERIKLAFDENGFTIPFPSRDLFVHAPEKETATLKLADFKDAA